MEDFINKLNEIFNCIQGKILYDLYGYVIEDDVNDHIRDEVKSILENKLLKDFKLNLYDHDVLCKIMNEMINHITEVYNPTSSDMFNVFNDIKHFDLTQYDLSRVFCESNRKSLDQSESNGFLVSIYLTLNITDDRFAAQCNRGTTSYTKCDYIGLGKNSISHTFGKMIPIETLFPFKHQHVFNFYVKGNNIEYLDDIKSYTEEDGLSTWDLNDIKIQYGSIIINQYLNKSITTAGCNSYVFKENPNDKIIIPIIDGLSTMTSLGLITCKKSQMMETQQSRKQEYILYKFQFHTPLKIIDISSIKKEGGLQIQLNNNANNYYHPCRLVMKKTISENYCKHFKSIYLKFSRIIQGLELFSTNNNYFFIITKNNSSELLNV